MGRIVKVAAKLRFIVTVFVLLAFFAGCGPNLEPGEGWRSRLHSEMPVMGHRNWIVVADWAYPAQVAAGLETIATGADQLEVVKEVLRAVDEAPHVRAKVYLDSELEYVPEKEAPGIGAYRSQLTGLLGDRDVKRAPHEESIARLDKAAQVFRVLILKTDMTLPYTSVFLELDCGYWSGQAEQNMRQAMQSPGEQR